MPSVVKPLTENTAKVDGDIFVVSHGWHTGFVVPAKLIQTRIPELKQRFHNTPYIEFGWGDQGFYQAKKITTKLTLNAIFWPTDTVIHAVAVPENVAQFFPTSHVMKICLNGHEYVSLIKFIENSFLKNTQNEVIKLKRGIYGNSQFYKGAGEFFLTNTCNKWTARGLKSAGMDINTTFKLTAESIMNYVTENNQRLKQGVCRFKTKSN